MVKPWEIDLSVYDDEGALLEGLRRKDRLACTCLLKRFAPPLPVGRSSRGSGRGGGRAPGSVHSGLRPRR